MPIRHWFAAKTLRIIIAYSGQFNSKNDGTKSERTIGGKMRHGQVAAFGPNRLSPFAVSNIEQYRLLKPYKVGTSEPGKLPKVANSSDVPPRTFAAKFDQLTIRQAANKPGAA